MTHAPPSDTMDNPWGLTPRESDIMDAICTHGCHKLAGRALNRSVKTVENHAGKASKKMPHRTPLARYLAWDRWMRKRDQATHERTAAAALAACAIAQQCIKAAYDEHWASFDALSDEFDDALAAVGEAGGPDDEVQRPARVRAATQG